MASRATSIVTVRLGVAAVVIKKLAGHSSIAVTNRYMHESEGDLREAINRRETDRLRTETRVVS